MYAEQVNIDCTDQGALVNRFAQDINYIVNKGEMKTVPDP